MRSSLEPWEQLMLLALDTSGVNQEAAMRLIFIGIVMFLASIAVADTGEAQGGTKIERGHVVPAPVGHRQPSGNDVKGDDQLAETGLATFRRKIERPSA